MYVDLRNFQIDYLSSFSFYMKRKAELNEKLDLQIRKVTGIAVGFACHTYEHMQHYTLFISWFCLLENDFGSKKENEEELKIVRKNNLLNVDYSSCRAFGSQNGREK